jgi:hypothetical protein
MSAFASYAPYGENGNSDELSVWNNDRFLPRVIAEACERLAQGDTPLLVPRLISLFLNLEQERPPQAIDWENITAIAVPGSRTYDRAAETFRAYLRSNSNAF